MNEEDVPTEPRPNPRNPVASGALISDGFVVAEMFRVGAQLGQGSTSEVFDVCDLATNEHLALKVFRPGLPSEFVLRIPREVAVWRGMTHENVCRMHGHYTVELPTGDRTLAIAMELLRGPSLEECLRMRKRFGADEALQVLRDIIAGLASIHGAGIIHRDLKPSNVLFVDGFPGAAKIVDFGLARAAPNSGLVLPFETTAALLLGTPAYMAPEQIVGEEVSEATDLYAAAVIFFQMLTGDLPVRRGGQRVAELVASVEGEPDISAIAPNIPQRWRSAIARCLRRDPQARFAHAGDFLNALTSSDEPSDRVLVEDDPTCSGIIEHARTEVAALMRDAVALARTQLGKPYRLGAKGPLEVDCSGLMRMCYERLPDGVDRQLLFFEEWLMTHPLDYRCAEVGDLLFLQHHTAAQASHVGIVTATSRTSMMIVHASESRGRVVEDQWAFRDGPFHTDYAVLGFGRVRPRFVRVLIDAALRDVREKRIRERMVHAL